MKATLSRGFALSFLRPWVLLGGLTGILSAASWDPAAADYSGRKGKTIYVSKLGDNSDGSSWPKAFHTIQAALSAVPDNLGGHRIVVRPDTYVEANLYTAQKGAAGAYNLLIGDSDGRLGSGATGRIVIDSGDAERGFKSFDWWSTMRAYAHGYSPEHTGPTFSSICWDRWILRNLYTTGSDAGLFWDLVDKAGEGFTVIVEDCVGIGRAFGGGFGYQTVREKEPVVFRRCYLMSLDWWGDAGGLAVGAYNTSPPAYPDVVCEDCTFVGPDNAVQILYPNKYIRVKMKGCRLITLNFSQPHGTPSTGVISSNVADPKQVHIDFEDCTLMGYKLFGTSEPSINKAAGVGTGRISYTTNGKVQAYVQYRQDVPAGFERLGRWPVEVFDSILPPKMTDSSATHAAEETTQQRDRRMAWWREARFGMFIHFGLFSLPTDEPRRMDKYFQLPIEEFRAMTNRFQPTHADVDPWVRLAKAAGMKYVVLVTKSHDGWCLFDSKHTEFDVMATPYNRDLLKPLAEACRREGLKICWYYSIIDWDHPDYLPRRAIDKRPAAGANLDRYVVYMKNQLRELLTEYGPVGVIWFDGNWDPTWTDERGKDLEHYIHSIQPDVIVNNRVGKVRPDHISRERPVGDFDTPEQMIPAEKLTRPDWETCMTMNNHWQFIDYDHDFKSASTLIRLLVDTASKGGNFLLDVGPQPDGAFPQPAVDRLQAIGRWMSVNGESIYGTKAGPLAKPFAWGRCTAKPLAGGKTRLYLHVFDWPANGKLDIQPLRSKVGRAYLLADPKQTALATGGGDGSVTIAVPPVAPDAADSVVVLEVEP